jgi:hypothetical protein
MNSVLETLLFLLTVVATTAYDKDGVSTGRATRKAQVRKPPGR